MPIRLPVPGEDENEWGDILNDFLEVEHNPDGTLKTSVGSTLGTYAPLANPTFTGTVTVPTPNSASAAVTKQYVDNALVDKADDTTLIAALPSTIGSNNQVLKVVSGTPAWAADANTTYTEISEAEITTGTASTLRTISGRRSEFIVNKARDGRVPSVDGSKLDGIEAGADVTDTANVASAGAYMKATDDASDVTFDGSGIGVSATDVQGAIGEVVTGLVPILGDKISYDETSTANMDFVLDEDDMASDSATKVPSQQSVKSYVDNRAEAPGLRILGTTTPVTYAQRMANNLGYWIDGVMGFMDAGGGNIAAITPDGPLSTITMHDPSTGAVLANVGDDLEIEDMAESTSYAAGGPVFSSSKYGAGNGIMMAYHGEVHPNAPSGFPYWGFLGLASVDGTTLTDIGRIITPEANPGDIEYSANSFSGSFVVKDGYVYTFFQDSSDGTYANATNLSVARTTWAEWVEAANNQVLPTFYKYHDGGWNSPGIGGAASDVLPGGNGYDKIYIAWMDITYVEKAKAYLMVYSRVQYINPSLTQFGVEARWTKDFLNYSDAIVIVPYSQDNDERIYITVAPSLDEDNFLKEHIKGNYVDIYYTVSTLGNSGENRWDDLYLNRTRLEILSIENLTENAVLKTDTSTLGMQFVVDEDDMASDSATKVPSQQSVKAYTDKKGVLAYDEYTSNGTWTKPAGAKVVEVFVIGGGGGGGKGSTGAEGTARDGGGGGGAGGAVIGQFNADDLDATVAITIGAGGAGGTTDGGFNGGGAGGTTSFGSYVHGGGGTGGNSGGHILDPPNTASGGAAGASSLQVGSGGDALSGAGVLYGAPGANGHIGSGGGGSSRVASNTNNLGLQGGNSSAGAGGAQGGSADPGGNGVNGSATNGGSGGGGGGKGQVGGNGGFPGGGGGGGGANATADGDGGNGGSGAAGKAIVITYG